MRNVNSVIDSVIDSVIGTSNVKNLDRLHIFGSWVLSQVTLCVFRLQYRAALRRSTRASRLATPPPWHQSAIAFGAH
jgi:hypothetical protein